MSAAAERFELLRLNVCLIALVAEWLEQVQHELVHVVAALLMRKRVLAYSFWAVDHDWPPGVEPSCLREGLSKEVPAYSI